MPEEIQLFALRPNYGYSENFETGLRAETFEGGAGRFRGEFVNQGRIIDLDFDYDTNLWGQYVTSSLQLTSASGPVKMKIRLILDKGVVEIRECFIMPGSVKRVPVNFGMTRLKMTVQVIPALADMEFNTSLVSLVTAYDGNMTEIRAVSDLLAILANETLPDYLGP
jgi:hypothetical protein